MNAFEPPSPQLCVASLRRRADGHVRGAAARHRTESVQPGGGARCESCDCPRRCLHAAIATQACRRSQRSATSRPWTMRRCVCAAQMRCACTLSRAQRGEYFPAVSHQLTAVHAAANLTSVPVAQAGGAHGAGGAVPVGDPVSKRHRASNPIPLRLLRHPSPPQPVQPPHPPPAGICTAARVAATWLPSSRRQRAACCISPSAAVDAGAAQRV